MFIQQAFRAKHEWWRYLIGLLIVIIGWQVIGGLPLIFFAFMEAGNLGAFLAAAENNFTSLGINSNLFFFLLLLTFAVGLGALLFVIKFLHNQPIIEATTSRKKMDWGRVFFSFGLVAIFILITTIASVYLYPEDYIWNFDFIPFVVLLLIALLMIPLQASFEEYLFRGYLMQGFGVLARNRWFPLLITSFIFGSVHFFNPEVAQMGNIIMVSYIGTGLLLGIMTLMDEGMELALGFHAGNNIVIALLVTADWTALQTNSVLKDISEPIAGWDILVPIFIIYPIMLFIMGKKYNWTNWKDKLFGPVNPPVTIKQHEES